MKCQGRGAAVYVRIPDPTFEVDLLRPALLPHPEGCALNLWLTEEFSLDIPIL